MWWLEASPNEVQHFTWHVRFLTRISCYVWSHVTSHVFNYVIPAWYWLLPESDPQLWQMYLSLQISLVSFFISPYHMVHTMSP